MTKLHNYHYQELGEVLSLAHLKHEMEILMANSKEVRAAVEALSGKVDALVAKGAGVPADVQADLDAIKVSADATGAKLDAAVGPVVPPAPVV